MSGISIIIPFYGDPAQVDKAIASVIMQEHDDWEIVLAPDYCEGHEKGEHLDRWCEIDGRIIWLPMPNERIYALKNIHDCIKGVTYDHIGIIDGDDYLNNEKALTYVTRAWDSGSRIIWTDHHRACNGVNCSGPYREGVDPYRHPWVTSHFRTFSRELFQKISEANFKDPQGQWFKRCYDQAMMLPMIKIAQQNDIEMEYIPVDCYTYCGDFEIGGESHRYQLSLEKFIRERGFLV